MTSNASFFRVGEVRPARSSDFVYFRQLAESNDGWKRRYHRHNIQAFTHPSEDEGTKMGKIWARNRDISADLLYDTLQDRQYRPFWDGTTKESHDICRISENGYIEYYASPPRQENIRAINYISGYLIKPTGHNSSEIYYLTHTNARGKIPKWAVSLAIKVMGPKAVKYLRKAARAYGSWKAHNGPDYKPWRHPEQRQGNVPQLDMRDVLSSPDFSVAMIQENHVNEDSARLELGLCRPGDSDIEDNDE